MKPLPTNHGRPRRSPAARRIAFAWLCMLVLTLMTTHLAQAAPFLVRDDRGVEHRFTAPPQRIVTLLPSLTESVWALGGGSRLVGVDRYSNWPAELASLPRLGGLDDALIEAIVATKPDVVLASTSARSLDRLEALGVTVVRLKSDSHADVQRSLDVLARLLGDPDAGTRLWSRLMGEVDAAARRLPRTMRGQRVYVEIGGGPYAAGTTSFIGQTLTALGLRNIVAPELGPFPKLNPEYVVRAAPDIVLTTVGDRAALAARPGWSGLPALQLGRVCAFETAAHDVLVRPGPRLGEAAGLIADCLGRLDAAASRP